MSHQFNEELFAQMGGVNWKARQGFFAAQENSTADFSGSQQTDNGQTELNQAQDKAQDKAQEKAGTSAAELSSTRLVSSEQLAATTVNSNSATQKHVLDAVEQTAEAAKETNEPDNIAASNEAVSKAVLESENLEQIPQQQDLTSAVSATKMVENAVVVIGPALDEIWENEESHAWLLWQNIMQAFGWDESQIVYYDLNNLAFEEAVYTTLEEVIDLGVEWVLTMDSEHPVSEQLADGVHVVEVPDLEQMLGDPYAKKSFYQAVVALT